MDDQGDGSAAGNTTTPAAPSTTGRALGSPNGTAPTEWPARVADTIEEVVAAAHDNVVRPLMLAARGVVFGIIIATMALIVSVLLAVALIRVLTVYVFGGRVWASYALVGILMLGVGAFAWSKRKPRDVGAT
jgi:hypothetical protein